jgi:nitrogen-specific signal transduction histidine kinase
MRAVLLVTTDGSLGPRVLRELTDCSVFAVPGVSEALQTLRTTEMDLVVLDVPPAAHGFPDVLRLARQLSASASIVCLYPADGLTPEDWDLVKGGDFLLQKPFTAEDLASVLGQAEEKQGLRLEVAALRARATGAVVRVPPVPTADLDLAVPNPAAVLKELAKPLSAGFDSARVVDIFLDVVGEMVQSSRAALLLASDSEQSFHIATQRGLAPHLAKSVRLVADDGLPLWLAAHGRPVLLSELDARAVEPLAREVARELRLLQAVLAVPLFCRGALVAILAVGQRISGVPYAPREVELLFDLAVQMAATIRHLRLHHQLRREQEYIGRVLSHMSSGVITIDQREKVTVMNRRAEQILGLAASEVVGDDLRRLPSPLGDLLYDSLRTGRTTHRIEVQLAYPKLSLEVSTYPLGGDDPALGAALVFEDLSATKRLAAEKRQREQFELLTRLVARLAVDIRRPLVSVQTFMDMFEERYDDAGFRERFARTMKQDAGQLVEMFDKLSALVSDREFTFETIDLRKIVEECLADLDAETGSDRPDGAVVLSFFDPASGKRGVASVRGDGDDLIVKCDRAELKKAVTYLLWYLVRKSASETVPLALTIGRGSKGDGRVQLLVSSAATEIPPDALERLFDLLDAVQSGVVDVGPFVSRRIVEAHSGRLQVTQRRREVCFVMELPLAPK